ncbi:hypothetical protein [Streptomyces sp. SGAir0957]
MTITALVSAKSCGVTTSALALTLASSAPSVLAECDPAGGTVRAGYLQSTVGAGVGLYHLAKAERAGAEEFAHAFASHLWWLDEAGHRKLLPGLTDPGQAAAMTRTWPTLAEVLHAMSEPPRDEHGYPLEGTQEHDVYIDAGRLALDSGRLHPVLTPAPLLYQADLVLLTVRGTEQSLSLARHVIDPLRVELMERGRCGDSLGIMLIEDGPYRSHQVAETLKTPVMGVLPFDAEVAALYAQGGRPPRGYGHRDLLTHARSTADSLRAIVRHRTTQRDYASRPTHHRMAGVLQRMTDRGRRHG